MSEQKLKKIGPREWTAIRLTASTNQRARENWRRERARRLGPAACTNCGAEPCGALWTRPGDAEPDGERCCDKCDHEPVEGWTHTHTAFSGGGAASQAFPVCALVMHEGETVYLRRDGTVQLLELRAPQPGAELGAEPEKDVPTVAFLGRDARGMSLHFAGEGGDRSVDLWANAAELDPVWLPVRMQGAVARDDDRKERRRKERQERESAHDRKVAALIAEEERKNRESIEKRALAHETRIVMDEVTMDENDDAEEALSMPVPSASLPGDVPDAEAESTPADPVAPKPVNLKAPRPVKQEGPGRPKRSARQRRARERQKRAWARQEARNRLEVKRLERLGRNRPEAVVKEEDKP